LNDEDYQRFVRINLPHARTIVARVGRTLDALGAFGEGADGDRGALHAALEQRVLDLGRGDRRSTGHGRLPGRRLRGLPAGVVRDADVPGATGGHREVQCGERLLDRGVPRPGVDLPEVDVVCPQPLERAVQLVQQGAARGVDGAHTTVPHDAALGRDDDLVAVHDLAE
jgi:hypothetical protein